MWPIIRGGVHNDNNNNDNKYLVGSCSPKREFKLRCLGLGIHSPMYVVQGFRWDILRIICTHFEG